MTAALRHTPDDTNGTPPFDGLDYQRKVNNEAKALWRYALVPVTNVGGTADDVTADSDAAVVSAVTAYVDGMKLSIEPAHDNTGPMTLDYDGVGPADWVDADGNAFSGGEIKAGRRTLLEYDGTQWCTIAGVEQAVTIPTAAPDIIVRDEKTAGTDGGTVSSGSYFERTLNTVVRNTLSGVGASLASSDLTLPAGTYYARWGAPGFKVNHHQTRLYNITDSAVIDTGRSAYSNTGDSVVTWSEGEAVFTIAASKVIHLEQRVETGRATDGLGSQAGFGAKEIYSWLHVWKIA